MNSRSSAGLGRIDARMMRVGVLVLVTLVVFWAMPIFGQNPVQLHGVVVDPAGTPVAGAVVEADSVSATTDARGRFELSVPPGRVTVEVRDARYATLRHSIAASGESMKLELRLVSIGAVSQSITVTGVRAGETVPVTKENIDRTQIDDLSFGQDVPELLRYTPSLTWYADSGGGSNYSYFTLRGIQQTRINMTFDGAPLNDPAEDALYFNNFYDFTSAVGSIQIQRGVGTSSVGTPSYGGSINFASLPFTLQPETEVDLGAGSWNSNRAAVSWQSGELSNGIQLFGRVSWADTNGYRDHSGSRHHTIFFNAGHTGERSRWKLVSFFGDERTGLSWLAVDPATLAENRQANPLGPEDRDHFRQNFIQLQYSRELGNDALLEASVYYNGAGGWFRQWDDEVARTQLQQYGIAQNFIGSLVTLSRAKGNLDTTVGVQFDDFAGDHTLDVPTGRLYSNTGYKTRASAFAKAGWTLGRWLLYGDAQLRWARFRYKGSIDLGSVDWTFFDPKIGARYSFSPRTSLYGSVGQAQREPTRMDMLAGEDNATVVHDLHAVKPERLTDFELGVDHSMKNLTVHANLYAMEFRNEIALTGELSDIGLPIRRNVDRSYRRGVELSAKWQLSPRWALTNSTNLSHNRIRSWTQYFDVYDSQGNWIGSEPRVYHDVPPVLTPEVIVSQGIEWSSRGATIEARGRWIAASYLDNTDTTALRTPSYATVDLHAEVSLDRYWSTGKPRLSVWVNNLTNEMSAYPSGYSYQYFQQDATGQQTLYGYPYFYPLATRNVMASLEFKF